MNTPSESKQRAAAIVVALSVALAIALAPYATGLLGVPVLYVALEPVHHWLRRRMPETIAATVVVGLVLLLLIAAGGFFAGLLVSETQRIAGTITQSSIAQRLSELKVGGSTWAHGLRTWVPRSWRGSGRRRSGSSGWRPEWRST